MSAQSEARNAVPGQGTAAGGGDWNAHTIESESTRATAWLSHGVETLMRRIKAESEQADRASGHDFDFVIVGSGYGGAVALSEIAGYATAGRVITVCLLERGNEYLPGAFPSRFADLAGHIRFSTAESTKARGPRDGLYDIRMGSDVCAVVANGLGGGSLINAGVMAMPHESVFKESAWPKAIREETTLQSCAGGLMKLLGATRAPTAHKKFDAMRTLGRARPFDCVDITVANKDGDNAYGVAQKRCIACGDCATGCNHQAKTSLDVTLLVKGRTAKAEIYTGATVLKLERDTNGWILHVVHTLAHLRRRQTEPFRLQAANVILCAGTFGSTEILLRSRTEELRFSSKLGRQFSANGDALAVAYDTDYDVNAIANEETLYELRDVGPTISGMVDLREGNPGTDVVIQDLGIPAPLRRLFEETFTTANAIHNLEQADTRRYRKGDAPTDPNAVDRQVIGRCLPVAMIGRDSADGEIALVTGQLDGVGSARIGGCEDLEGDGAVSVRWPSLRDDRLPPQRHCTFKSMLREPGGLGGRMLPNPMWRLLPPKVASVLGEVRGPALTVHPLGGCPMGEDVNHGVVDDLGRVFDPGKVDPRGVHDGLFVLDGSIIPTSLGINPSLTIASLAQRAVRTLRENHWKLSTATADELAKYEVPNLSFPRPIFRSPRPAVRPADTMLEFTEQLRGRLRLRGHRNKPFRVELTLWFQPIKATLLAAPDAALTLDPQRSELCIYPCASWPVLPTSEKDPLLRARLSGDLRIFRHESSFACQRILRGMWAWAWNRGFRDIAQFKLDQWDGRDDPANGTATIPERIRMVSKLASRAGDRRLLEYDLKVHEVVRSQPGWNPALWLNQTIRGEKRLTYEIAANPWIQLMNTRLTAFPCWSRMVGDSDTLEVHLPYFGWVGVPLVHFVGQEDEPIADEPTALADLASVWMYVVRTLLHLHTWSLRKPDPPANRTPQRLPGVIQRIVPEIIEFAVARPLEDGTPVLARLTRYSGGSSAAEKRPVLMIHGYSASGTTFAHPAVPGQGLAGYLCTRNHRDVWVLDMRSSAGMPTATHDWAFEDMGYADIPLAVDHIVNATGSDKIDIVAHCMGVAMLFMGILGKSNMKTQQDNPFELQPIPLRRRINKLVMSQVGPVGLVLTPSNLLRAYLMRYLKNYLRVEAYRFRPDQPASKGDELLDRLLSTVPYPSKGEFRLENPLWPLGVRTPWVGVRHRMDALYGVTFKLENLSAAVLEQIDDFFGPMNFQTVSQVIHFAENTVITDRTGEGCFVDQDRLTQCLDLPILHIQGTENGLVHIDTSTRLKYAFDGLTKFRRKRFAGFGHQDCMIGLGAEKIFAAISAFLERK